MDQDNFARGLFNELQARCQRNISMKMNDDDDCGDDDHDPADPSE